MLPGGGEGVSRFAPQAGSLLALEERQAYPRWAGGGRMQGRLPDRTKGVFLSPRIDVTESQQGPPSWEERSRLRCFPYLPLPKAKGSAEPLLQVNGRNELSLPSPPAPRTTGNLGQPGRVGEEGWEPAADFLPPVVLPPVAESPPSP